jgi:hypothetical protein
MLNQQPRMRVNTLFNYLVEMHSVSPSLKQQVRNCFTLDVHSPT